MEKYVFLTNEPSLCGAYGTVEIVKHKDTGEKFAMKTLPSNDDNLRGINSMVLREISILKQLYGKPNVVYLQGEVMQKQEDNSICFLMPYYASNLKQLLRTMKKQQNPSQTINLYSARWALREILTGIQSCHECNVIHRDIKPENILCNEEGSSFAICDFGLSRFDTLFRFAIKTHDVATIYYRPPELLCKYDKYDFKIDIWSFGIVAIELLIGRCPWRSKIFEDSKFSEQEETDFLNEMFQSIGVDENSLHMDLLPKSIKDSLDLYPRFSNEQLIRWFTSLNIPLETHEFLTKVLQFDPRNRLTATALLKR